MTHTIKKGSLVKSITYEKDLSISKEIDFGPIIFDYNFGDKELVETTSEHFKFERKSEDGKIHHYFVKR